MIQITKPVKCPICGQMMTTCSFITKTQKFLFVCNKPLHTKELTEEEYIREIKSNR